MKEMGFLSTLLLLLLAADLLLLIAGLIRPTLVIWWEDIQNRRRVIKIYGRVALVLWIVIVVLEFLSADARM
jgi:uncharacterized membrane protein YidH (DUF202 family)